MTFSYRVLYDTVSEDWAMLNEFVSSISQIN